MGLFFVSQVVLRVLVIASTLAAAIIMGTSQQTASVSGIQTEARYSYAPAFRFNVVADSVVSFFSAFSLVLLIAVLNRPKSNPNNYFYLLLTDLVILAVLVSGFSAALAIESVGRTGTIESGWSPICDHLPKFCDRITASLESCFVAVLTSFVLTILSAHKLFKANSKSKSVHVDAPAV